MKNTMYVSEDEIEKIEKVVLDKDVIEERKHNNENLFAQIQIKKALSIVKKNLKENETIDSYISGRNYSIDSVRLSLAASIIFARCSHPIYRWNSNCLLVKTNTRLILVELTVGFDYSASYEIDTEIHLVTKNDNYYLIVSGNDKKTIIQFNNKLYDMTIDILKDSSKIIKDKDFTIKGLSVGINTSIIFMSFVILITLIVILIELNL